MSLKKTQAENDSRDPIIVEAQRYRDQRANTYREQALKIYPWICARCGRDAVAQHGSQDVSPRLSWELDQLFVRLHHGGVPPCPLG